MEFFIANIWPQVTIPNLLLVTLIAMGFWVFSKAQQRPTFEIGDMLIDENGKASSSRFAVFIALALSTYLLAFVTINKTVDGNTLLYLFGIYIVTWASSKSLENLIQAWGNNRQQNGNMQQDSPYGNRYPSTPQYGSNLPYQGEYSLQPPSAPTVAQPRIPVFPNRSGE